MRAFLAIMTMILCMAGQTNAQTAKPAPADIRLDDGSCVRMSLQHEAIDVQTKYGKLTIPIADIRRIEFGLHIPPDQRVIIDRAIKRLASAIHKEREGASSDLLAAGHFAAPALRWASKSADQETANRAASTLAKIAERVPSALIELPEHDTVHTTEGAIRGTVLLPAVKTTSPHFGQVELHLAGLRSIHVRMGGIRVEVVVDAAKGDAWIDTGFVVDRGERLVITADGIVDVWPSAPGQYLATPKGYSAVGKGGMFPAGALVGRIGDGKTFLVGDRHESVVNEEGRLYLQVVGSAWNCPSAGSHKATVSNGGR